MTPATRVRSAMLRRISESSNADTVVSGQYAKFGDQIRIDASCRISSMTVREPLKIEAASEKEIPGAVDALAESSAPS